MFAQAFTFEPVNLLDERLQLQSKAWILPRFRLAVHNLFADKFVGTLLLLGLLSLCTPFDRPQFSRSLISMLDMATLALLTASPIIIGKTYQSVAGSVPCKESVITRH